MVGWDKLREHVATLDIYYIFKSYDNGELRCYKDRLAKDREKAIASFMLRSEGENANLLDSDGLVIASIQSPEKVGTKPFETMELHSEVHRDKNNVELVWRAINKIPDHYM